MRQPPGCRVRVWWQCRAVVMTLDCAGGRSPASVCARLVSCNTQSRARYRYASGVRRKQPKTKRRLARG
eukprot:2674305-Prymnesium_polylepis.1